LRFLDARNHLDILANGITFTRTRTRELIESYLGKLACCGGNCGEKPEMEPAAGEFFRRALTEQLSPADVFRITITSFLDAYNFDVRRLMKCCTHHVLPSGHVIPFCAYNVLYREGHVPLPALHDVRAPARTHSLPVVGPSESEGGRQKAEGSQNAELPSAFCLLPSGEAEGDPA
jgi:hypothetical protein